MRRCGWCGREADQVRQGVPVCDRCSGELSPLEVKEDLKKRRHSDPYPTTRKLS